MRVEILTLANPAFHRMLAYKTIEQAPVTLAAVAVTIARLLIENFLDTSRDAVGILCNGVGEERRAQGGGQGSGGHGSVKRGNGLDVYVLRGCTCGSR